MERILYVIEESLKVTTHAQFYRWALGALKGLFPHEILLCVCGDLPAYRFYFKAFSSLVEDQRIIKQVIDANDGVLNNIIEAWLKGGRKPLMYAAGGSPAGDAGAVVDSITGKLRHFRCGNVLAHGNREMFEKESSLFVFLQMPNPPAARESYLIDLVMPHLHMALYRTLRWETHADKRAAAGLGVLSTREEEVLRWVGQGKTNQEIGGLLGISPLTVKNHVQKILRKLRVSNRAQAVFKVSATGPLGRQSRGRAQIRNLEKAAESDD
jgi:transcriptional regulator EpsA